MPEILSDDGPRRLRLVYLGPKGLTFPFEWTYTQLLVCFTLGNTVAAAVFAVSLLFTTFWGAFTNGITFGLAGGIFAGVQLMKRVSHDQPVTYLVRMWWWLVTRQGRRTAPARYRAGLPPIADLTTPKDTVETPQPQEDDDDYEEVAARAKRAVEAGPGS